MLCLPLCHHYDAFGGPWASILVTLEYFWRGKRATEKGLGTDLDNSLLQALNPMLELSHLATRLSTVLPSYHRFG